jgi:hypothetical protein
MCNRRTKDRPQRNFGIFPVYPLLFGIFPVLSLAANNVSQVDLSLTYRSILLSVVVAISLFGVLRLALHDWSRAAFLTFLLLILFFSYGHVFNLLKTAQLLGTASGWHTLLLPVWAGLAGSAVWISAWKINNFASAAFVLNFLTAILLVWPVFQIVRFEIKSRPHKPAAATTLNGLMVSHPPYPDIYYIILDAYDRADTLKVVYDYDNSAFLDALTKRGFYIASCSQSNYAYTQPSLTSSLNLDYLDKLSVASNDQADSTLQENVARQFLKAQGYAIVAFETGFSWSQWEDADFYYQYRPTAGYLNGFEALFLHTTLVRIPLDTLQLGEDATYGIISHNRILYVLDTLKNLPGSVRSPKFVFAHLSIPHPPFVFSPNGELVTARAENATSVEGYRNSVTFISQEILQVVDRLIASSKTPPVIVIQGDHGAPLYHNPLQRMAILNAYYLPGSETALYPSISPINTFRIIFNSYFGQDYPLLKDVSWYSPTNRQYDFAAIPNECDK